MMWTPEIVSALASMKLLKLSCRLPNRGFLQARHQVCWPPIITNPENMKGLGSAKPAMTIRKKSRACKPATSDQVTPHEECLNWTINLIELKIGATLHLGVGSL